MFLCSTSILWASSHRLGGFRQSEFQTSLLSYRDDLENWNFTCSKFTYHIFKKTNNKGDCQAAELESRSNMDPSDILD